MKHFYTHIIDIESILISLDEMELSDEQKLHLSSLIDATIHQTVLDLILSKLSNGDEILFVNKLKNNSDHKELMEFLSGKIDNVEDEIKQAVSDLKKELHEDIKDVKKR